jgi:UDP-N-acetylmuramoylalanine--D-glutamate ligase
VLAERAKQKGSAQPKPGTEEKTASVVSQTSERSERKVELKNKHVVVVGLAQTGVAVANFCLARQARVTVSDGRPAEALGAQIKELEGCEFDLGGHSLELFTSADLIVMSPGVPELEVTRRAREAGVEVIAEIELAYRFFHPQSTLIAITGTNGKSTTTALTGSICQPSGRPTFCGGNLGNHPLIEAVDHPANCEGGLIVAEVAGFMLETCTSFRPQIGACLNISPDHLDRYGDYEIYASMKTRIFKWLQATDHAIANARDSRTVEAARNSPAHVHLFDSTPGAKTSDEVHARINHEERSIELFIDNQVETYATKDLPIVGNHNLENAMAAYLCARLAGVAPEALRQGARDFHPQKHRMELVAEQGDVQFYDDSKGTNVAAVAASLYGFPRPVVLIAGGVDKGGAYDELLDVLQTGARGLVLIGEAAPIIRRAAEAADARYPIVDATDMNEAVVQAQKLAEPGDAVVLSPACSSYDMFKNFGERGMAFRDAVNQTLAG